MDPSWIRDVDIVVSIRRLPSWSPRWMLRGDTNLRSGALQCLVPGLAQVCPLRWGFSNTYSRGRGGGDGHHFLGMGDDGSYGIERYD